jgi:hypothetical protein
MSQQPTPYTKGHRIAIIHHENEYKIVCQNTPVVCQSPEIASEYYTIEEDTIIPHADGHTRILVAVRDGASTFWGIPLYHHLLTISETKTAESHTRTIKTRIVYDRAGVALITILAFGLAGIVYKIAQKVEDTYVQSTHA